MKFFNLLKKEIKELVTRQVIVGMVFSLVLLFAMGKFMSSTMQSAIFSSEISIMDLDNTEFTNELISQLGESGFEVKQCPADLNSSSLDEKNYSSTMNRLGISELIVIPKGFTDSIFKDGKPAALDTVCTMESVTSIASTMSGEALNDASDKISEIVRDKLFEQYGVTAENAEFAQAAVEVNDFTVAGDKSAQASVSAIGAISMLRNMIVIMVIFFLVMFASQMIVTAIATEKIDKTLETLLSAPVSRLTILAAKMTAATIVAIINAVVYMIGFSSYMTGMSGGMSTNDLSGAIESSGTDVNAAIAALGFSFSPSDFVLIGLQMFMTILIALAISLMLGALAKDAKSTQTLIMPIIIAIMIPFLVTLMGNINDMPTAAKLVIYAIPFTHTFIAMDNLAFGNTALFWGGLAYQIAFFAVCMFFAVKLFTTDKIFTMSISFSKKKKETVHEE